ncbi:MAG: hypothetical protein F6J98_01470 [Moorea sp. SIO4G2]|nr:hypothetical protein [Moorena sp. SIO4G2]
MAEVRQLSKNTFWELSEAIEYYQKQGRKAEHYQYSQRFDQINEGLFGHKAKKIKELAGVSPDTETREYMGVDALTQIELVQATAAKRILRKGVHPKEAIAETLEFIMAEPMDFRN